MKWPVAWLALILLVGVSAWSPWISASAAEGRAKHAFEAKWSGVQDGCGFNCVGCGASAGQKTFFGRKVTVEYACGLLPSDSPEYHKQDELYVSFVGTVYGIKGP